MSSYADLIPGTSPSRRSAYEDLLPGSVPAAPARPAEVAAPAAEPAALPGAIRRALTDIEAAQPARAVASRRGGIRIIAPDPNPPVIEETPTAAWSDVMKAIIPGAGAQIRSAVNNLRRMANAESIAQREEATGPQTAPGGGTLPLVVQRGQERQRQRLAEEIAARAGLVEDATAAAKDLEAVTPKDMSTTQRAVFSAGTSAPTTLAAMAAGILTRNPALAMAIGGGGGSAIQAGSTYGEALDKGATHRQASVAGTIDGLIEGLDALPIGTALKAGSPFMVRVAKTLGTEGATEAGQQVLQDLRSMAMENPNLTLGEVWENAKVAGLAGTIGGAVHGTIGAAANAGRQQDAAQPAAADPVEPQPEPIVAPSQPVRPPPAAQREEPSPEVRPTAYDDIPPAAEMTVPADTAAPAQAVPPVTERPSPGQVEDEATSQGLPDDPIVKLVTTAIEPGRSGNENWTTYRKVEAPEAEALKEVTGTDFTGFQHHVDESAVRHVLKEHGDPQLEARRGQIPVTREDFALLPQITDPSAAMVESAGESNGLPLIRYTRQIGDTFYVVEEVRRRRKRLALKTMYKTRAAPDAPGSPRSPAQTPETFGAQPEGSVSEQPDDGQSFEGRKTLGSPGNTPTTTPTTIVAPPTSLPPQNPAVAAPGATPPAQAKAKTKQQGARPDAIRTAMRALFGAPISEKGLSKKYLGIYKIKPQTIRLQNRNDLETAAHEIGHHISNTNRPLRKAMRANARELISIAPTAYLVQMQTKHGSLAVALQDPDNVRFLVEEGFAEFISYFLNDPNHLTLNAPQFLKAFEGWLGSNPTIAKSLEHVRGMIGAHQSLGPADKMMAKVGAFQPGLGARIKDAASRDTWDTFVQATLDRWAPLQSMVADLAPGVEASKNPYLAARLLSGDAAVIEDWINDFTVPFDYQQRLNPKNYGKPLKKILEPVLAKGDEEVGKFKAYLIARRAAELKKVGKENLFTKEEIDGALKLETSEFKKVAAEIYEYNDRLLAYAQQGGLLSAETVAKFKEYENYIPFFREPDGDAPKGDGRGNPFKRLTGGTANVRDPIANLIQNTANIIHATNRNAMVQKAAALAKAVPGGGRWLEVVKVPQETHAIATQRIIEQLQQQGIQVDISMASNMAAIQTFFTPSGKGDDRTRTIVYKSGGDLRAVQVNDPLLWKTLGNIPPVQMGLIGKILAFPAQTLRAGVVLDPTFMVRNGVRDTLSATVQSRGKFLPGLSTAQGIKMMAQQKDAYKLWRAFGGAFSDQFRDAEEAGAVVERMAKRGSFSPSSIITPTRWLDALKHVGSFTESGSRIAEFEATYKPGDIDSALQAALNSREVSTDFGMRGGHEVVQVLTRLTPFMNPAMQGLYKTARVLSGGDGRAAAAKAAIVGANMALLSVALALLNSDGDWYQRLEEWEKATYWHFKLGDNVYRIPKPFEYGALFASVPEAIALRAADAEDGETFKKRMLQVLGQVLGFRMIPQTVAIVAEPWANKSLFTGRPIVPDRQEHLEPGLQSTPGTSKSAQVIGEAANVSPAVIDNVVRNVFGTLGVHVATAADMMVEASGAVAPGRAKSWQSWPVLKAFVHDPDNPNTKQQTEFFDALQKYRRAVASLKELETRGDEAKADAYRVENADKLERAKAAEATAKRLAKIRKAIRAIEADRNMSPQEKREAINEQNLEIRELVEEQTPLYQQAKNLYGRSVSQGAQ